jgi:3-hydroxybutyrate dehydrogenase
MNPEQVFNLARVREALSIRYFTAGMGGKSMKRVALVTGAASGIGRAIAEALAADGNSVMVTDVNEDQGRDIAAKIDGAFVSGDLSRREECRRVVDETVKTFGKVDILINNAGFQHISPIADFSEDIWDKLIAVMLTAPFLLSKYSWNYLVQSGQGRIINVASVHGVIASPFKAAYVTAKHGLVGMTRTLALEGGEHGLTVNAVCPAYVRTPLVENQVRDQAVTRGISENEVIEKVMLEPAAIKKLLEPSDVANLVVFLCSPAAWGITGSLQLIDLGWTAK